MRSQLFKIAGIGLMATIGTIYGRAIVIDSQVLRNMDKALASGESSFHAAGKELIVRCVGINQAMPFYVDRDEAGKIVGIRQGLAESQSTRFCQNGLSPG